MEVIRYDDDPVVKALVDPDVFAVVLDGPEGGQPVRIEKDNGSYRVIGGATDWLTTVVNSAVHAVRTARNKYHGARE